MYAYTSIINQDLDVKKSAAYKKHIRQYRVSSNYIRQGRTGEDRAGWLGKYLIKIIIELLQRGQRFIAREAHTRQPLEDLVVFACFRAEGPPRGF